MCLTFLALAIVIFTLPNQRVAVRSSIEIGFTIINEKQEPLVPIEQVARRIPSVYAPAVLVAMEKNGTAPSILSSLQNPSVENIGGSVVVVSNVDPSAENEAKEFQAAIADQVIKQQTPRVQALREGIATKIASAIMAFDDVKQEVTGAAREIEHISPLIEGLRGQIENERANLATLYQRAGAAQQPAERSTLEAQIRELQEQISTHTNLMGELTLERAHLTRDLAATRRLYEQQTKAVADVQLEQKMFSETHISLPPSLMPPPTTKSRGLSLLVVAFAISILVAFGTVVLVHNIAERKT
jgi:hypothetical protein